jgi:hypothetical protein
MKKILLPLLISFVLAACGSDMKTESAGNPLGRDDALKASRGKVTGDEGILLSGEKKDTSSASPLGVNSFLWRATLDTFSFMPLVSADPFGGTIITDWYEDPKTPGERFKVNALILDKTLRADGVKVTVFKQKMVGGTWRDQKVDSKLARSLEDTILTRARQLKVGQGK